MENKTKEPGLLLGNFAEISHLLIRSLFIILRFFDLSPGIAQCYRSIKY